MPSAVGADGATWLFVLEADEGEASAAEVAGTYDLSLTGVGGVSWFSDRPIREAGDESLDGFVAAWPDRFATASPNATLTIGEGDDAVVAVVTLSDPVASADTVRASAPSSSLLRRRHRRCGTMPPHHDWRLSCQGDLVGLHCSSTRPAPLKRSAP